MSSIAVRLFFNGKPLDEKFIIGDYCRMKRMVKTLQTSLKVKITEIKHGQIKWSPTMGEMYLIEELNVCSGDSIFISSISEMVNIEFVHHVQDEQFRVFGSMSAKLDITEKQLYDLLLLTNSFIHPEELMIKNMEMVNLDRHSDKKIMPCEGDCFYLYGEMKVGIIEEAAGEAEEVAGEAEGEKKEDV